MHAKNNPSLSHVMVRWIAKMTAVEIHAIWERFAEARIVAELNHRPAHFLKANGIVGVKRVSSGLASYVVRGGRFFDFRSVGELMKKANRWFGDTGNPFRVLTSDERSYLDVLAAIRNYVVHHSDFASRAYRRVLRSQYGVTSAPEPEEFLNALDRRAGSPARGESRLWGLATIVSQAINRL